MRPSSLLAWGRSGSSTALGRMLLPSLTCLRPPARGSGLCLRGSASGPRPAASIASQRGLAPHPASHTPSSLSFPSHTRFRVSVSLLTRKLAGVFIETALNLQTGSGGTGAGCPGGVGARRAVSWRPLVARCGAPLRLPVCRTWGLCPCFSWVVFLPGFKKSSYFLEAIPLSHIHLVNVFCWSTACNFIFLSVLRRVKDFNCTEVQFFEF